MRFGEDGPVKISGNVMTNMTILSHDIHTWAREQGFYDREGHPSFLSEKLLLAVSEIAEVQDCLRDGDRNHEAEEVADAIIRLLDYAAYRGFDIDVAVARKMAENRSRPRLHGRTVF